MKKKLKTETGSGVAVKRVVRRTAQLYKDADYVRLFDDTEDYATADIKLGWKNKGDRNQADAVLANFGMRRTGRWNKTEWGYQAIVECA